MARGRRHPGRAGLFLQGGADVRLVEFQVIGADAHVATGEEFAGEGLADFAIADEGEVDAVLHRFTP